MTQSLTVLMTNISLGGRSGTEIQTRNIALELLRQGHRPVVYSPDLGPIATELRNASIPVVSDLNKIEQPIDIVHGNHLPTTVTAVARFPQTPAIFFCHDFVAWHDAPPLLPAIRRYVAVDETVYDRLTLESGISADKVRVLLNAVDTRRFLPGPALPVKPRRALAFAKNTGHIAEITLACQKRGIHLDVIGSAIGRVVSEPEHVVCGYDLVFTSALSAMEVMATGRAVVVCDGRGLAGMCNATRFAQWRRLNFGLRTLRQSLTSETIGAEIDQFDARQAEEVAISMRAEGGLTVYAEQLTGLYLDVLKEHRQAPHSAADLSRAISIHLQDWYPNADGGWPWLRERQLMSEALFEGVCQTPLDTPMAFDSGALRRWWHAIRGFSAKEAWGVWTNSSTAIALIRVAEAKDLKADFSVIPYLPDGNRELRVEVMANGLALDTWHFIGPVGFVSHERYLRIPKEAIGEDGAIWIVFNIQNARSPRQLGQSGDARVLGIGLRSLIVRASPSEAEQQKS